MLPFPPKTILSLVFAALSFLVLRRHARIAGLNLNTFLKLASCPSVIVKVGKVATHVQLAGCVASQCHYIARAMGNKPKNGLRYIGGEL